MNKFHSRRDFLGTLSTGIGGVALASLMQHASAISPHHAPKAKRVIQLFMNGGASQCDLFDYKPQLIARQFQYEVMKSMFKPRKIGRALSNRARSPVSRINCRPSCSALVRPRP